MQHRTASADGEVGYQEFRGTDEWLAWVSQHPEAVA